MDTGSITASSDQALPDQLRSPLAARSVRFLSALQDRFRFVQALKALVGRTGSCDAWCW